MAHLRYATGSLTQPPRWVLTYGPNLTSDTDLIWQKCDWLFGDTELGTTLMAYLIARLWLQVTSSTGNAIRIPMGPLFNVLPSTPSRTQIALHLYQLVSLNAQRSPLWRRILPCIIIFLGAMPETSNARCANVVFSLIKESSRWALFPSLIIMLTRSWIGEYWQARCGKVITVDNEDGSADPVDFDDEDVDNP